MGAGDSRYNQSLIPDSNLITIPKSIKALKSVCKIRTATKISSGFLLKLFKNEEDFFCLITNEHVITKEMISNKDKIEFYYDDDNKIKIINLDNNERYIKEFTEINLDAVII